MTAEIIVMWGAVTCYAIASVLFGVGTIMEKRKLLGVGYWIATAGIGVQLTAVAMRWFREGRGPMLGYYEIASKLGLLAVVAFVLLAWRKPNMRVLGLVVMPVAMLLVAASMFSDKSGMDLTGPLASYWLLVHVIFANLAFAAFVVSFAVASAYVIRVRSGDGPWARRLAGLPSQEVLDDISARFVVLGFLFWGVMIASGAIWANEAWGRYWGWDPIETWALVVWFIYAAFLHARLVMGWRGERSAWIAITALPVCAFCLLGIPALFNSVHAGYMTG